MHLILQKYYPFLFILLLINMSTQNYLNAQKTRLYFESYTMENGLSTPQIRKYTQDTNQIIWMATSSGLVNYNGYFFKVYNYSNSKIPSITLSDIITLKNSVLLISTLDKGFFTFNIINNSVKSFYKKNSPLSNIYRIFVDADKKLWIATNREVFCSTITIDSLLNTANNFDKYFVKYPIIVNQFINDCDKNIWMAGKSGLLKYNTKNKTYQKIKGTENLSVKKVLNSSKNKFLLVTNKGLLELDTINHKTERIDLQQDKSNIYISDIVQDSRKNIWISTVGDGLLHYNTKTKAVNTYKSKCVAGDLTSNVISRLYLSPQNILFLSILNNGLNITKIDSHFFKYYLEENPKNPNNMIWGIYAASDNKIYFAGKAGLNELNPETGKIINRISGEYLYKIFKKDENNILCNSSSHLFNYDIYHNKVYKIKTQNSHFKHITGYYNLADTAQIISYLHGGVIMYDMKGNIKKYLIKDIRIGNMLYVGDSVLWLATRGNGLLKYSFKNDKLNSWTGKQSIGEYIISLYKDSSDILWVGTFESLAKFDLKTETIAPLKNTIKQRVYAIEEDDKNNLWISTNDGLFKLNKKTLDYQHFNIKHGLQSNDFNELSCAKTPDGHLLFGGPRGLNYFYPDSVHLSTYVPKIVLTRFLLFHKEYLVGDKYNGHTIFKKNIMNTDTIFLYHDENTFSIKFVAVDIFNSKNIRYKYRLKGYEEKWISANVSRQGNYTNLSPGKYIFQIKSTNSDGVWVDNTKNVYIFIQPAIWQQTWFKIGSVLLFIFLIFLFMRIRMHRILVQQKKLKQLVEEQTQEIIEKNIELEEQTEELNKLTEQLRKANRGLEKKVKKRTYKLNKALKNAEKAEKLISSFLSNISHEIRTPLNAIAGFTQIIINTQLNPEQKSSYGNIIEKNVDTLLEEIDNIMNISKLHTGKYQINSIVFSLNEIFNEITNIFKTDISKNKNVKLIKETSESIHILSDKYAFKHIVYQLVDNALKYTEKGEVVYGYHLDDCKNDLSTHIYKTIHKNEESKPDCFLTIYVRDTGIGISQKQQKYIFDAFMKIERQEKLFRGTGLGLSLVKKFAEIFNAKIKVNSQLNKGTEIIISIPLSKN